MKRIFSFVLLCCLLFIPFRLPISAEVTYDKVYCRNALCENKIALTFDDGPHPRYTQEILKILEEFHVTATFFIIGVNAENYPSDLEKIVASGCEIGNHTYSHRHLNELSLEEMRRQIIECEETIHRLCGVRPRVFRPPEGRLNEHLKNKLREMKYHTVLWSIDTMDWAMNPSEEICKTVRTQIRGGDIILMHDYVSGGNTTCQALRILIPELLARGYEFVTISELIEGAYE